MRVSRTFGALLLPLLAAAASAAQTAPSAPPAPSMEEVRRAGAEVLFWNQEQRDRNFRSMEKLFPAVSVDAGERVRPLPAGKPLEPALGGAAAVDALMASMNMAGLLVLQDGKIRLERYARGYGPEQTWTSFSVAKSITSTLVGAAVKDGFIKSLDDPVTRYIPELKGSAYDGVSVRHVLTMTSGVRWNEDYTDPKSDVARMFSTPPPLGEDVTVAYLRKLPREAAPGSKWVYKTGESNLIGVLVARAVREPLSIYLWRKIWSRYGMERDAHWQVDENGQEIGGCCLSASLRDYGRFGQFILDGGRAGYLDVLPAGWVEEATRAQAEVGTPGRGYGYQWWTGPEGTFSAVGIFGQMIHIDPARKLVIVTSSAASQATGRELSAARAALVMKISAAAAAKE
ncbi:MAG TPA: serine hydrolase domain-containing protein [Allosphingosinicella sp.]|jgi:CubicO group peptidase (beta-lactamase class C family)